MATDAYSETTQTQTKKPNLNREEERKLFADYKANPTDELRNRIVEQYLQIAKYHASRIKQKMAVGYELDELVSCGVFGLMDAIEEFDPDRGCRFSTFCVKRVRGAMIDELRTIDWAPRLARSRAAKIEHAKRNFKSRFQRSPTHAELAAELGMSEKDTATLIKKASIPSFESVDKPMLSGDGGKATTYLHHLPNDKSISPTENISKKSLRDLILRGLRPKERQALHLYYYEKLTMKEVSEIVGVCESRVSQIISRVMPRLKKLLKDRIDEFYV